DRPRAADTESTLDRRRRRERRKRPHLPLGGREPLARHLGQNRRQLEAPAARDPDQGAPDRGVKCRSGGAGELVACEFIRLGHIRRLLMKNSIACALAGLTLIPGALAQDAQPTPEPPAAMKKVAFMVGKYKGPVTVYPRMGDPIQREFGID